MADLRNEIIHILEEALARAKGEYKPFAWEVRSKSWPFTKLGLLLVKAIALADTIADELGKEK